MIMIIMMIAAEFLVTSRSRRDHEYYHPIGHIWGCVVKVEYYAVCKMR